MKRTSLFCAALATAVALFALGEAQAAGTAALRVASQASGWISAEALTARLTRGSYRVTSLARVHGLFWRAQIARSDGASFRVYLAPDGTPMTDLSLSAMD